MKSLLEFYQDKETTENVKNYLINYLGEKAKEKTFNREDVSGIADAKEAIEEAFENLGVLFPEKVGKRNNNESR